MLILSQNKKLAKMCIRDRDKADNYAKIIKELEAKQKARKEEAKRLTAVSYTHLDVYKRQYNNSIEKKE